MEDKVPFKVFTYWEGNEKPEVRRFGVEKSVVTSYAYLKAKLLDIFPNLKHKHFTVSWKDEDGDDITMSTDDEIMVALLAMVDVKLIKLNIHCQNKMNNDGGDSNAVFTAAGGNAELQKVLHNGVTCDGCGFGVWGFRYKCMGCDDYDLCSSCEASGLHPEHCLVRLPRPNMHRNVIRSMIKMSRYFLKSVGTINDDGTNIEQHSDKIKRKKPQCVQHGHPYGRSCKHDTNRDDHHCHPRTSWLETFGNYMNEFANLAGDVKIDIDKKPQEQAKKNENHTLKEELSQCPSFVENLDVENIQKLLKFYVGSLKTSKGSTSNNTENSNTQSQGSSDNDDNEIGQGDCKTTEVDDKVSPKSEMPSTSKTESKREQTPEIEKGDKTDGWTVINTEKDLMDANYKSGPSYQQTPIGFDIPKESKNYMKIPGGQNIYPPLNIGTAVLNLEEPNVTAASTPSTSSQAQDSVDKQSPPAPADDKQEADLDPSYHPQAHIDAAIKQMIAMGFTNNGGWLTQLLVKTNANIPAVLDLLTPVNLKK